MTLGSSALVAALGILECTPRQSPTGPPGTLSQVIIAPKAPAVDPGQQVGFAAHGKMSNGDSVAVTVTFSATGGTISASGLYTAGATPGTYRAIAVQTGGTLADTAAITVRTPPVTLVRVILSPDTVTLTAGATKQFSALGKFSDSSTAGISVNYAQTGGSITVGGLYTAGSTPGTYRVIATLTGGTLADTSQVTIVSALPPTLVRIILSPDTVTLNTGATKQFSTLGKFSDSSTAAVTGIAYTTTNGSINSTTGLYTAPGAAGTAKVIATKTSPALADTSTVTIVAPPPPSLVRIILSPDTATVVAGATKQFSTVGKYSDSSTAAITVGYTATGGSITPSGGLYTAGSTPGTFKVIALHSASGFADTSTVTITAAAPTLVRIILSPDTVTLNTGATKQFSVLGKFSDSSTAAVTVTYSATGGTISSGGLYTAGSTPGSFRVIAVKTSSTLADTSTVTIVAPPPPTLVRIILSPDTVTLNTGATKQFATVGKFSDSSTAAVTGITYTTTNGSINASTGLYTAPGAPGTAKVIATKTSPTLADTSTVTIVAITGAECASPQAAWLWCDDFEQDRLGVPPAGGYFEVDDGGGSFTRTAAVGMNGSFGMQGHFGVGQVNAGALHIAFGKTPISYFKQVDAGTAIYREIYWRIWVRNQAGWKGGGHDKLSRGIVFASGAFAEAAVGHVWSSDPPDTNYLALDPASGTDPAGNLVSTGYNSGLTYLGLVRGATPMFDAAHVGSWYCVEAHMKLNDAGLSNGVFELWINGTLDAQKTGMNWLGSYSAFGINSVYFENYWNDGAPQAEDRFFDNIIVSTQRIGC